MPEPTSDLATLDMVVLAGYLVTVLAIGFIVSARHKHGTDLFLAGRNLRWPSIGLSILGTNVSPAMLIASCGAAYGSGMAVANFEWMAWIFMMLLAMVFLPHYLNTRISTMPEFLERRYSPACRNFLSWYVLFTTVILWLGGSLYAGGLLLSQFMGWHLVVSILVLITIATIITIAGGLAAVVVTDAFQMVLMIIGSALLVILGLIRVGGIDDLIARVPATHWPILRGKGDPNPWYAFVLGYPVLATWFWCTDQTIVQRALGARSLNHGQRGIVFAGYLKLLTPILFFVPGILCLALFPGLEKPENAYLTMVTELMPVGMVGLIVAVLVAALISTIDSGLNSFSTVFTLDIYRPLLRPDASDREIVWAGRLSTIGAALIAILMALLMTTVAKNLFDLLQSIIGYFAPPMATVFLLGVLWRRATAPAALVTMIAGTTVSLTVGLLQLKGMVLSPDQWPHYLIVSFLLFVFCMALMIVTSLLTSSPPADRALPTLDVASGIDHASRSSWLLWLILAAIMATLYIMFGLAPMLLGS